MLKKQTDSFKMQTAQVLRIGRRCTTDATKCALLHCASQEEILWHLLYLSALKQYCNHKCVGLGHKHGDDACIISLFIGP